MFLCPATLCGKVPVPTYHTTLLQSHSGEEKLRIQNSKVDQGLVERGCPSTEPLQSTHSHPCLGTNIEEMSDQMVMVLLCRPQPGQAPGRLSRRSHRRQLPVSMDADTRFHTSLSSRTATPDRVRVDLLYTKKILYYKVSSVSLTPKALLWTELLAPITIYPNLCGPSLVSE